MRRPGSRGVFTCFLFLSTLWTIQQAMADGSDILQRGATIYRDNCQRCHGPASSERIAEGYPDIAELAVAIARNGCRVTWASHLGGSLSTRQIDSVASYLYHIEDTGEDVAPLLGRMPATKQVKKPVQPTTAPDQVTADDIASEPMPAPLLSLMKTNPVARGGYLYTQHCYRCHLAYDQTRQGRQMSGNKLTTLIANGKTSTQMRGFAVQAGGKLFNGEITAIVRYIQSWEEFAGPPAIPARLLEPPAMDPADLLPLGLPRFPPVRGDALLGQRNYLHSCSPCHGSDRRGLVGPGLLGPWNTLHPVLWLKSVIKNGVPDTLMVANERRVEHRLSARAIDDLLIFLITAHNKR